MPVDHRVLIGEVRRVIAVLKDAPREIVHLLEGSVQVIIIVLPPRDRIGDIHGAHADPADHLRVDLLKLGKVHRIHQLRKLLRLAVLNRTLPVRSVKNFRQRLRILQTGHIRQHRLPGR